MLAIFFLIVYFMFAFVMLILQKIEDMSDQQKRRIDELESIIKSLQEKDGK